MASITQSAPSQGRQASSLLELIDIVDNAPELTAENCPGYTPWFIGSSKQVHGFMTTANIEKIMSLAQSPLLTDQISYNPATSITILPRYGEGHRPPAEEINTVLQQIVDLCIASPSFPNLTSHSEYFLIISASQPGDPVKVERFAATIFGINTRGAHLTAFTPGNRSQDMQIHIAKRSRHLVSYPGLDDSSVAGGVKAEDTPRECILAECEEEASLPRAWVEEHLQTTSVVTLANVNAKSKAFHGEILYCYDLEIPESAAISLQPGDDEVEEFYTLRPHELIEKMLMRTFKPNVCPVMIDFLVRRGIITGETEPDYVEICRRLRRKLPMATAVPGLGVTTMESVKRRYAPM